MINWLWIFSFVIIMFYYVIAEDTKIVLSFQSTLSARNEVVAANIGWNAVDTCKWKASDIGNIIW